MKRARILLIHFNYFPPRGGGEYAYFKIYEALKSRYEVRNLSTTSFLFKRFARERIKRALTRYMLEPSLILYPMCVRGSYDLIFTSWSAPVPFFGDLVYAQPSAGALARPMRGLRSILEIRQSTIDTLLNSIGTGITWPWREFFGSFSLKYHSFISNSLATKKYIEKELKKPSLVVYPPVATHLYAPEYSRKEDLVLSIGEVIPEKRFHLIGVIGPRIPEAKFVLIGRATNVGQEIVREIEERFKRAGLRDNFVYLGRVSTAVKNNLLDRAKVLFHPSFYESFGIAIVEGMAAGAMPVAHNSGGPPEFLEPNNLFSNLEEATARIRNALNESSSTREDLQEIASRFSEERFKEEILQVVSNQLISGQA